VPRSAARRRAGTGDVRIDGTRIDMYRHATALEYFRMLVEDDDSIPLLEAAASIAQDAHPALDLQAVLARFDRLAGELADACRSASTETARLQRTLRFYFGTQGFAGNAEAYDEADNSYLHRVLETRRGIPISLAVLFVELAGHVGLDADGVAFPGHFLVRVNLREGIVVVDPFTGESLDRDELERRAAPHGVEAERLLGPASDRQVLVRMLNNLRAIHARRGQAALLSKVEARLRILGVEAGR
jgi:regulator of sirC expression with transglutaminase-like and TPR domain